MRRPGCALAAAWIFLTRVRLPAMDLRDEDFAAAPGFYPLAVFALWAGPGAALGALAGLALGHVAMRTLFERRLGGYTGDALGAVQQVSELGFYAGLAAWW